MFKTAGRHLERVQDVQVNLAYQFISSFDQPIGRLRLIGIYK